MPSLMRTWSGLPGNNSVKINPSGNPVNDSRVEVQFHDHPQALTQWCKHLQGDLDATDDMAVDPALPFSSRSAQDNDHGGPYDTPSKRAHPRLSIAIHITGSRGDVQSFIPIAQLLAGPHYGHRVRICTHPQFKDFVEAQGVEFFSIGGDPEALMAYMVKNPGLVPSRASLKAGDVKKRRKEMWEIMNGCWRSCIDSGDGMGAPKTAATVRDPENLFLADLIIANPPSMAHIHCAEKLHIPLHMVFTMPWSPTEAFPHPLAGMSYGATDQSIANYLSFIIVEMFMWEGLCDLFNKLRMQILHLDPISPLWGSQLLFRLHVPYSYLWSQVLVHKPKDWRSHLNITGFCFLPLAGSYTPPPELSAFLENGPLAVYIGFGSIVVDDPQALTTTIFDAVKMAGVRAIISKGWGKLGGEDASEDVYLIDNCPHDWLFQRVSAVIHHGGAGTTAAGIAAGKPTVVVPFFGDQPFWGQMIARAGAGPVPVPYKEMTAETLAASISFAMRPEAREAAQEMAQEMAQVIAGEDGAEDAAEDVHSRLDIDSLQCAMCPDRLANWKHKATGIRLSGFALACLVDKGLVDPHDVELVRHKHWHVDDGSKHPLLGAAAAGSSFLTAIAISMSDYSQCLKKRPRSSSHTLEKETPESASPATTAFEQGAEPVASLQVPSIGAPDEGKRVLEAIPYGQLDAIAFEAAAKLVPMPRAAKHSSTSMDLRRATVKAQYQGRLGNASYITHATGRLAADFSKACLKVPVAFCYNVSNGFHNLAWYSFAHKMEARRRGEVNGWESGFKTAGKEFALGVWDAFSGVVLGPYEGIRQAGAKGVRNWCLHGCARIRVQPWGWWASPLPGCPMLRQDLWYTDEKCRLLT